MQSKEMQDFIANLNNGIESNLNNKTGVYNGKK